MQTIGAQTVHADDNVISAVESITKVHDLLPGLGVALGEWRAALRLFTDADVKLAEAFEACAVALDDYSPTHGTTTACASCDLKESARQLVASSHSARDVDAVIADSLGEVGARLDRAFASDRSSFHDLIHRRTNCKRALEEVLRGSARDEASARDKRERVASSLLAVEAQIETHLDDLGRKRAIQLKQEFANLAACRALYFGGAHAAAQSDLACSGNIAGRACCELAMRMKHARARTKTRRGAHAGTARAKSTMSERRVSQTSFRAHSAAADAAQRRSQTGSSVASAVASVDRLMTENAPDDDHSPPNTAMLNAHLLLKRPPTPNDDDHDCVHDPDMCAAASCALGQIEEELVAVRADRARSAFEGQSVEALDELDAMQIELQLEKTMMGAKLTAARAEQAEFPDVQSPSQAAALPVEPAPRSSACSETVEELEASMVVIEEELLAVRADRARSEGQAPLSADALEEFEAIQNDLLSEKRAVDAELSAARVQARRSMETSSEPAPRVSGTIAQSSSSGHINAALACNAALAETRQLHQARFCGEEGATRRTSRNDQAPPRTHAAKLHSSTPPPPPPPPPNGTHESESMLVRKVRMPAVNHPLFGDVELEDGAHVLILRRYLSSHYYGMVLDGESAGQTGLFLADACCREEEAKTDAPDTTESYLSRAARVLGVEVNY